MGRHFSQSVRLQAARALSSSIFFNLPTAVCLGAICGSQTRLWLKFCSPTSGLVAAAPHLPGAYLPEGYRRLPLWYQLIAEATYLRLRLRFANSRFRLAPVSALSPRGFQPPTGLFPRWRATIQTKGNALQ